MRQYRLWKSIIAATLGGLVGQRGTPAHAVTINLIYTDPSIYANAAGQLSPTTLPGYTDVTAAFHADGAAAVADWQRADMVPFTLTTTVSLANLASEQAVGNSLITSFDANGRPTTSQINVDDSPNATTYVSANPYDNSAYNFTNQTQTLNGNTVNTARFGQATTGPASTEYDLVTLFLHELGHSLGFSGNDPDTIAMIGPVGNAGDPDRTLTIPTTVSGFATSLSVPLLPDSTHFDGIANGGVFNDATLAQPGFDIGQRALLTGLDVLSICTVDQATAGQCNPNASSADPNATTGVPEPSSLALLLGGLAAFASRRGKQTSRSA